MTPVLRRRLPRLAVALLVVGVVTGFFTFGPSEAEILGQQAEWKAAVNENLLVAVLIFFVVEVVLVGLSVPVATPLSLIAGLLFGRWLGTLVVSFASTLGALIVTLLARYVFRDSLRRRVAARPRWQAAVDALDRGVERDGWYYLLLVRLTPVLPFFLINLGMGLTRIRPRTYWWATQLGMLPSTLVVVSAGAEVGEITSFRELASFERLWPLMLLVLVPIALRIAAGRYLRRHPEENPAAEK
jgi:uncharacterized membrane protein YdjX (TVP38/TMEM64 family)